MKRFTVLLFLIWTVLSAAFSNVSRETAKMEHSFRNPSVAGMFYPSDPAKLHQNIISMFENTQKDSDSLKIPARGIRMLIVPHAGYIYSGNTAAKAYSSIDEPEKVKRVILLGCHHRALVQGATISPSTHYQTPLGALALDLEQIRTLSSSSLITLARESDHSLEVQLPFLQTLIGNDFKIIPVLLGQMTQQNIRDLGNLLAPLLNDETLLVISSDFTHYGPRFGYSPFPPSSELLEKLDMGAIIEILALKPGNLENYCSRTGATICGAKAIETGLHCVISAAACQKLTLAAKLLNYTTSSDITGSFSESVSYAAIAVFSTTSNLESSDLNTVRPKEAPLGKAR
jgi:hypothetical protein